MPRHPAVLARPGRCEGLLPPFPASRGSGCPNLTWLLPRPGGAGLSSPLGHTAPRCADRVDEDHRVDRVQGPVGPFGHLLHDLMGDLGGLASGGRDQSPDRRHSRPVSEMLVPGYHTPTRMPLDERKRNQFGGKGAAHGEYGGKAIARQEAGGQEAAAGRSGASGLGGGNRKGRARGAAAAARRDPGVGDVPSAGCRAQPRGPPPDCGAGAGLDRAQLRPSAAQDRHACSQPGPAAAVAAGPG